jgi:hypothetical protein
MKAIVKVVLGTLALAGLVAVAPPVSGQAKKDAEKDQTPKVKVERGRGGKKIYRITQGFVIEGRIQKPNAFYVLQRSQINYDWAAMKKKFVPRILDAVRKSPF